MRIAFFGEDRTLDVTPHHIQVADKEYRLGASDLKRIEVIKLGWMNDVLIYASARSPKDAPRACLDLARHRHWDLWGSRLALCVFVCYP